MRIFHHNDLDGRAAAAIINQVMREAGGKEDFIEMEYSNRFPIEIIKPDEQVFIVDFSLKPPVMEELLLITKKVCWIDHHKTAMEYTKEYSQELDGIRHNDFSGCELTWRWFYPHDKAPKAITLIGDRDCWRWKYGDLTANFNLGLYLYDNSPMSNIWSTLLQKNAEDFPLFKDIAEGGRIAGIFRKNFCEDYANSYGFETEFEGHKCFALGIYMFGSEAFGKKQQEYDICLSFEYDGERYLIGLYSEKVDVSEIAKKYGGGGHKGAAGFLVEKLPFRRTNENIADRINIISRKV